MGNSFQDQLLKAGLVNKKQIKKAKHEKRISKTKNKGKAPAKVDEKRLQEQAALKKRNQELNRQRNEEIRQKELLIQAKQLIENNRLTLDDNGDAYYFAENKRVKRIFVSDKMREQLSQGKLAIVRSDNGFEVVNAKVARQIAERTEEVLVVFHDPLENEKTISVELPRLS